MKKTTAFIIGRRNIGEADKIITAYTKDFGKLSFVARGIRKIRSKMAGHVELFSLVDIQLAEGKKLDVLTAAKGYRVTSIGYRIDPIPDTQYSIFYTLAEVMNVLLEEEGDEDLWDELVVTVRELSLRTSHELSLLGFIVKLLGKLGYQPELYNSVADGRKLNPEKKLYFLVADGGISHKTNGKSHEISVPAIKLLRFLSAESLEKTGRLRIEDGVVSECLDILVDYIEYISDRQIKSMRSP